MCPEIDMSEQPAKEQRRTRQRAAIDAVLNETKDFTSAQELYGILRDSGSRIGLATVYRTLQTLADDGRVDVLRTAGGEALYRRCADDEHHHHLVCRSCGATVEISRPAVETWADQVAAEHGYVQVTHTVELFGLCPKCAKNQG
jgi:Fur family transcriptional regulator, ferric uptake regulator